jgi:hypothetical protein
LEASGDTREQLIVWDDRLERAQLRRTGFPAGVLLFTFLAFFLFWNDYDGESWLRAELTWIVAFGVGVGVFLVVNEFTARRTIRRAEKAIHSLRNPNSQRALDGGRRSEP